MQKSDKERILQKLDEIDKFLNELSQMKPSKEEYVSDIVSRRACEKTIELAIESVIDVSSMVVSYERLGTPDDENHIFSILETKKVITRSMKDKIMEMKGFRNILVHRYGQIDDDLVYDFLENDLKDFEEFSSQIAKFIKNR